MTQDQPPQASTPRSQPKRKPSHLRSAGKVLAKEARRIVKKHRGRLGEEMSEQILGIAARVEARLKDKDYVRLEAACEELDEVLHKNASFARKGALRETVENVGMAVIVALGLRSCLYEPFKIPSPSMVPTLVPGDHIFVNKFRFGVQIPFTTTIVGEDMVSGIQRGEVVVFRYPLDPEQDYIKRVVGLPGDELRIKDEFITVKRAGETEFEPVPLERLEEPCPDDFGEGAVDNCLLFKETYDGHEYVIRVDKNAPGATRGRFKHYKVPEGHIMVMGDNRRHSADSLQWTRRVEAVFADKLITDKDLRDTTQSRIFRHERGEDFDADANIDEVTYVAERNSPEHDMRLQVWRDPSLGIKAVYSAASLGLEATTLAELARSEPGTLGKGTLRRIEDASSRFLALTTERDETRWTAAVRLRGADGDREVVAKLECGVAVCTTAGEFARELLALADAVEADEDRPARELMRRPGGFTYTPKWVGRDGRESRFFDQRFHLTGPSPENSSVLRIRAWRQPNEGKGFISQVLQAGFGAGKVVSAPQDSEKSFSAGDELRLVETESGYTLYGSVAEQRTFFAIECGRDYCTNEARAVAFVGAFADRAAKAATEASVLERLVSREWLESKLSEDLRAKWTAGPKQGKLDLYEWDELNLVSRVRDTAQSARIRVEQHAGDELQDALAANRERYRGATDAGFAQGFEVTNPEPYGGFVHVLVEPQTNALVHINCTPDLCEDIEGARELAKRAIDKAKDTRNFVDPSFLLSTPYVPRGNVKGRAERIWAKRPEPGSWFPYRLSFDPIR